jgi:aryl-alcohol dehydrogenase-like predicted oxidoreductase
LLNVTIPKTDLAVFPIALGIAGIGVKNTEESGKALLDRFIELGGNLIHTARVYSDWVPGELHRSERILGDWLSERNIRKRVLVSTMGGHPYPLGSRLSRLSSQELTDDLDGSLKSLRVEMIDLYWLHRDDPELPVGPIMDSLHRFQAEGRIRFYAASNWSPDRIRTANAYAQERGYTGFVASQVEWNLGTLNRLPGGDSTMLGFFPEFLRLHRETGLTAIPYSPQAGGYFGKRTRKAESIKGNPYDTPVNRKIHACLVSISDATGFSINHLVLAYLWSHGFPVIPLVGCRTPGQLEDSMAATGCRLPEFALVEINALLGFDWGFALIDSCFKRKMDL